MSFFLSLSYVKILLSSEYIRAIALNLIASAAYDGGKFILGEVINGKYSESDFEAQLQDIFFKAVAKKCKNTDIRRYIKNNDFEQYKELLLKDLLDNISNNNLKDKYLNSIYKEFKSQFLRNPKFAIKIIELYGKKCLVQLSQIESVLEEVKESQKETNQLLKTLNYQLAITPNHAINDIVEKLHITISSLHVKTAYEQLCLLRSHIKSDDCITLSLIDYNKGLCSKYVDKKRCVLEFGIAYDEMCKSGRKSPEIIAGKIYALIIEDKKRQALELAQNLRLIAYTNIWGWIPELIFSNNKKQVFCSLPNEIQCNEQLIACTVYHTQDYTPFIHEGNNFEINILDEISFENIPIWLLHITITFNRFIERWSQKVIFIKGLDKEDYNDLYSLTKKYIQLINKTELPDLVPDINFINLVCEYGLTKNDKLIEEIKDSRFQSHLKQEHHLLYSSILRENGRYDEAKSFLNSYGEGVNSAVVNFQIILALETCDPEYASNAIHYAAENSIIISKYHVHLILACGRHFTEYVKDDILRLKVDDELQHSIFLEICKAFIDKDGVNLDLIEKNESKAFISLVPFIALVYHNLGFTEKGLELIRSCIDDYIDMRAFVYVELLSSNPSYNVELYNFLKKVRENGFTGNINFLLREYNLACRINDYEVMRHTSKLLYEKDPQNSNYLNSYIMALCECGEKEEIKKIYDGIRRYDFDENETKNVFNVLIRSELYSEAVEFLYECLEKPDYQRESLYMLFHEASMIQSIEAIVHQQYSVVYDGAYVYYSYNGEQRKDIIKYGNRLDVMIGRNRGEEIVLENRLGKQDVIVIQEIYNKYHKLIMFIYEEIRLGKFNSACTFYIEDLEGGEGILYNMSRLAGNDGNARKRHAEQLNSYRKGNLSLGVFIRERDMLAGVYNVIFGDFDVYCQPYQYMEKLYGLNNYSIAEHPLVLDISSLVLMHELYKRFNINIECLLPKSVKDFISDSNIMERISVTASVHPIVKNRVTLSKLENGDVYKSLILDLLAWIEEKCKVVSVEDKLNFETDSLDDCRYTSMVYDCILLAQKYNATFVTEDLALIKILQRSLPISNMNTVVKIITPELYDEVSNYFIGIQMIGTSMDADYLIGQYEKYVNKDENYFTICRKNLKYNFFLCKELIILCRCILSKNVVSNDANLLALDLLSNMFKKFEYSEALRLSNEILRDEVNQVIKRCVIDAFKIAHPIILN